MKVIQLTDLPVREIYDRIKAGEDIDRHNILYGYDALKESGWEVTDISEYKRTFLNRVINGIGFRLGYTHLVLQLKCLRKVRQADLIYCHILQLAPFLSLMKRMGLLKTPVLAIAHDAFSEKATSFKTWKGLDKVLSFGEKTRELVLAKHVLPSQHRDYIDWGVDVDFYTNWAQKQAENPRLNSIVVSGGANRDNDLMVEVFRDIPELELVICNIAYQQPADTPQNVLLDRTIDRSNVGKLRPYYYHSLAVGIPLKEDISWCNGSTVLFEAMSMSKPVIMTATKANLIDIEKEKIGITVGFGDKKGWIDAIRYLENHPEEAREMGERGYALVQKKYNYNLFCNKLLDEISRFDKKQSNIYYKSNKAG